MKQQANVELVTWMEDARIGAQELADFLRANGHTITPQRISQWRNGATISEFWQSCLRQVMADVAREDMRRAVNILAGSPAPDSAAAVEVSA